MAGKAAGAGNPPAATPNPCHFESRYDGRRVGLLCGYGVGYLPGADGVPLGGNVFQLLPLVLSCNPC